MAPIFHNICGYFNQKVSEQRTRVDDLYAGYIKIIGPKTAKDSFQTAVVHKTSLLHDPYELLVDYLKIRVAGTASLFTLQDGLSVTRTWFREHVFSSGEMYGLPKGLYAAHSCRAGGATYLASKGLSDGELQNRGR